MYVYEYLRFYFNDQRRRHLTKYIRTKHNSKSNFYIRNFLTNHIKRYCTCTKNLHKTRSSLLE